MPRKVDPNAVKTPTGAILSKYLRQLAVKVETVTVEGDPLTKAQLLGEFVWKSALGWVETCVKSGKEIVHPPDWRAVELLYNRIEGKIPLAVIEDNARTLAEKVSDLGKARLNALAAAPKDEDEQDTSE